MLGDFWVTSESVLPHQGKNGLSPHHHTRLRPKVSKHASSPGHSRGRFVQAPPTMHPVARLATKHKQSTSITVAFHTLCCARQQRPLTRHRQVSTCAPAPLVGRRRAFLLHVALPAPSAPHMLARAAGPRAAAAAGGARAAATGAVFTWPWAATTARRARATAAVATIIAWPWAAASTATTATAAAQRSRSWLTQQHLHQRVPHVRCRVGVTALYVCRAGFIEAVGGPSGWAPCSWERSGPCI